MTMQVEKMKPINPGNPFLEDSYHMGTDLGTNCTVMYKNFPTEECPYLIIIDTTTGERIIVRLTPEKKRETFPEKDRETFVKNTINLIGENAAKILGIVE